jgi:hypothetical protein
MVTVRAKLLRDLGPLESQLEDFLARMDKSERDRVFGGDRLSERFLEAWLEAADEAKTRGVNVE